MSGIASEADIEKMIVDRAQHGEALAAGCDHDQVPPARQRSVREGIRIR